MSASESWICQFCGLVTAREEKPDAGPCCERDSAAHVWVKTSVVSDDKELSSHLFERVEVRRGLVESVVRGVLGEKLRDGDVEHAWETARTRQIDGESWQAALSRAEQEAAADCVDRDVRGWMCLVCGLLGVFDAEPRPVSGPACGSRSGAGHMWNLWSTPDEYNRARERWTDGMIVLARRLGEVGADRVAELLRDGKGYLEAVKMIEAELSPRVVEVASASPAPAVEPPPAEARRGRGRPPKARAVAPEPSRVVKAPDEPSKTPKTAARLALEAERARIEAELAKIEEPAAISFYACTSSAVRMAAADGRSDALTAFAGLVAQIGRLAPLAEANGNPDSEEQAIFAGALRSLVAVGGYLGLDLEQAMSTMVDGAGGES